MGTTYVLKKTIVKILYSDCFVMWLGNIIKYNNEAIIEKIIG